MAGQPSWPLVVVTLTAALSACGQSAPDRGTAPQSGAAPAAAPIASTQAPSASSPAAPVKSGSADADAEYNKGVALAAARRFAEARQVFEEAARLAPTDGSLAAAVAMFGDLTANRISEDVLQRLFRAGEHANAGRPAEANADLDEAIRLAPRYARAHALRGALLFQDGKLAEALEVYDRVLQLDPEFAEGYHNRGAIHSERHQYDEAIRDFTRAITIQPVFWDAYTNRGSAY